MPLLIMPVFGSPVSLSFSFSTKFENDFFVQRKSLCGILSTPPPVRQPSSIFQSEGSRLSQPSRVLPSKIGTASAKALTATRKERKKAKRFMAGTDGRDVGEDPE